MSVKSGNPESVIHLKIDQRLNRPCLLCRDGEPGEGAVHGDPGRGGHPRPAGTEGVFQHPAAPHRGLGRQGEGTRRLL